MTKQEKKKELALLTIEQLKLLVTHKEAETQEDKLKIAIEIKTIEIQKQMIIGQKICRKCGVITEPNYKN